MLKRNIIALLLLCISVLVLASCSDELYGHDYSIEEVTKAATCSETGIKTITCSICGDSYTVEIPKTEHTYGNSVITTLPTCKEFGESTYTCTICGETKTEAIAKISHTWDVAITANDDSLENCYKTYTVTMTCTVCSATETTELDSFHTALVAPIEKEESYVKFPTVDKTGSIHDIECISHGKSVSFPEEGEYPIEKLSTEFIATWTDSLFGESITLKEDGSFETDLSYVISNMTSAHPFLEATDKANGYWFIYKTKIVFAVEDDVSQYYDLSSLYYYFDENGCLNLMSGSGDSSAILTLVKTE